MAASALTSAPVLAAKTDIVVLKNGDRITGEVKAMERGRLRYSTNAMGTIYIEWDDIESVTSNEFHRVLLTNGRRYYGTLSAGGGAETLAVEGERGTEPHPLMDYARITPVEEDWKARIDLSVGAGYGYSKASDVTTLNAYADLEYVGEKRISTLSFRSDTTDDGEETTTANRLTGQHNRLWERLRFGFLLGQAEQNDELDVDLRLFGGGGVGKYFVMNNRRRFMGAVGAGVVRTESGDGSSDTDLEGVIQTSYESYLYDSPKLDLTTNLLLFPSITQAGRVRANYEVSLRREFIEDLFFDLNLGGSYDTDPDSEDANNSDYSVTTGVSYDF